MSDTQSLPSTTEELPAPSAELTLIRVLVSAHLATSSRRKGDAFLEACALTFADEERLQAILPIRPPLQQKARRVAQKQALAMFNALLPVWLAWLPPR